MSAQISFIDNWMIRLRDMPKYTDFEGEFIEPLDYPLLKLLHESNNPLIKPEMKTLLKNTVLDNINKSTGELKVRPIIHSIRWEGIIQMVIFLLSHIQNTLNIPY